MNESLHASEKSVSSRRGGLVSAYLGSLAMVGAICALDYLLGFKLSMAGLYVIPVGLISWRAGKRPGALISTLSAVGVFVANALTRPPAVSAMFPLEKAGEGLVFFLIIAWLVAMRREEQEKREKLMAQLRESAVLEERNRIAGEIHDTLAQGFTGIVVQLEAAEDILAEDAEVARGHLERARKLARQSLADARRSVTALRAPELKAGSLGSAIRQFVEQIAGGTSTAIDSAIKETPYPLPMEVEYGLLRICQEAVVNALRHAKAGKIRIELTYQPAGVRLSVQDDGRGFDARASSGAGGFGLLGMQERATRVGVKLEVRSQPGAGTHIVAVAPAPGPPSEESKS